jgi:pimeloyl-ACP methyl ester carboxylesterase
MWGRGTDYAVYSVANAKEEIGLFTGPPDAKLEIVQGGKHFLSWSHPKEVFGFTMEFVKKCAK